MSMQFSNLSLLLHLIFLIEDQVKLASLEGSTLNWLLCELMSELPLISVSCLGHGRCAILQTKTQRNVQIARNHFIGIGMMELFLFEQLFCIFYTEKTLKMV